MELKKKYGLPMAICMVVGIVIGSGVFFKAQTILQRTNGDMMLGVIAWAIGGAIMLSCALTFAIMATKYQKVNGVVDYAEATMGKGYAYVMGWFTSTMYYPALSGVLCWLTARYTLTFITSVNPDFALTIGAAEGGTLLGPECLALTMFFLCLSYAINALSPKLAGKLQISTTVIKLIPLGLMAIVGTIYGISNGMTQQNFMMTPVEAIGGQGNALFMGVVATSFAYEGWIIATSINAELRDAKKTLPKALVVGSIIIIITYVAYFIGVAGGATVDELVNQGATTAFTNIFGNVLGNVLNLFIAISCFGTLNGLMMGSCRGFYALASRGQGPKAKTLATVDSQTNMPGNAAVIGLFLSGFWACYFYFANLTPSPQSWFSVFVFDSSELPIIMLYALYIPIFIAFIKKQKGMSVVPRVILPSLAILGSLFMIVACVISHGMANVYYLILCVVVMGAGALFYRKKR